MGAVDEMLEQARRSTDSISLPARLGIAARFFAGYLLAVATGAIAFSITAHIVPDVPMLPDPSSSPVRTIIDTALIYFIFGVVFAIPYTLLGSLAVRFWLPPKARWFLLVGMFCPPAAILLLRLQFTSLPAGLAAAYVYGAVAFGRGFGRWRAQ